MSKRAAQLFIFVLTTFPLVSIAHAQGLKGRLGWGFGLGAQQQYSDLANTPFGFGGEGLLTYRLTDKVSVSFHTGYNTLGFRIPPATKATTTNLIYGDLVLDYELSQKSSIRPFFNAGVGAFNFLNTAANKRFFDGEFLLGAGFRIFLSPSSALTFSGNAKYTTGDDLDGATRGGNNLNDAYFSLRTGLTFYLGAGSSIRDEELFTDLQRQRGDKDDPFFTPIDEAEPDAEEEDQGDYGNFLQKISSLENSGAPSGKITMTEYIRLKSRIDELNSMIENKEREISNLQITLTQKQGTIAALETQSKFANRSAQPLTPLDYNSIVVNDFSSSYEQALSKFYARQHAESIAIFEKLMQRFPNHSLASNCQYWIGENYFAARNYSNAIDAFQRVLSFERSLKKDDALMMMGRAYMELGMPQDAREAFNRLLQEYPQSEFVEDAEKALRNL